MNRLTKEQAENANYWLRENSLLFADDRLYFCPIIKDTCNTNCICFGNSLVSANVVAAAHTLPTYCAFQDYFASQQG